MVAASVTEAWDYRTRLPPGSPARRLARWHVAANLIATALFVASLVLRLSRRADAPRRARRSCSRRSASPSSASPAGSAASSTGSTPLPRAVDLQTPVDHAVDDARRAHADARQEHRARLGHDGADLWRRIGPALDGELGPPVRALDDGERAGVEADRPEVADARHQLIGRPGTGTRGLEELYRDLPVIDFSRQILQRCDSELTVLAAPPCGWTDLGTPRHLLDTLAHLEYAPRAQTASITTPALVNLSAERARLMMKELRS